MHRAIEIDDQKSKRLDLYVDIPLNNAEPSTTKATPQILPTDESSSYERMKKKKAW